MNGPRAFTALAVAAAATACAPRAAEPDLDDPTRTEATRERIEQLLNTDNGLDLRVWTVADDPQRIGSALVRYADGPVLGPQDTDELRRSGLRFVRVRADRLRELLDAMAAAPVEVAVWHGQVLEWRQMHHRPVADTTVVGVGGRPQELTSGWLRLMVRSWTLHMEDGPYLQLELLPEFVHPQARTLHQLLGGSDLRGTIFTGLAVESRLEAGYGYVLTGESPGAEWPQAALPDEAADASRPSDESSLVVVADEPSVGPDTVTPATLGEFLFTNPADPPTRTVLVFVPRIPSRLFQPYRVTTGRPEAQEGSSVAVPE